MLPTILGLLGGAVVIGGVAWWILSKKAKAAQAEQTSDQGFVLSPEAKAVFDKTPLGRGVRIRNFDRNAFLEEKKAAEEQGLVYLRPRQKYISPDVADQLIATGDFKYDKNGVVIRAHLKSLSDEAISILDSL